MSLFLQTRTKAQRGEMSSQSHTARAMPGVGIRSKAKTYALFILTTNLDLSSSYPGVPCPGSASRGVLCSMPAGRSGPAVVSGLDNSTLPLPCGSPGMGLSAGYELFYIPAGRLGVRGQPVGLVIHKSIAWTCMVSAPSQGLHDPPLLVLQLLAPPGDLTAMCSHCGTRQI